MSHYLQRHTLSPITHADSLSDVPLGNGGGAHEQKLILISCHGFAEDDFTTLFNAPSWKPLAHNLIALYNARRDVQIEASAMRYGARGVLYEDNSIDDVLRGICSVSKGDLWISRRTMSECLKENFIGRGSREELPNRLTRRERDILKHLASGESNETIAERLFISTHTVKTHLYHIFKKIDASSRLKAVLWAKENL